LSARCAGRPIDTSALGLGVLIPRPGSVWNPEPVEGPAFSAFDV